MVTLTIGDGSGLPGSSGNPVEVSLENPNDKVNGLQVDICDVDDYLSCTACETAARTSVFSCSIEEQKDGCCRVIIISFASDSIEEGTGPIFTITYDVTGEAPAGECRDLNPEGVKVSDEIGEISPEDVITEPGEFCFSSSSTTTTTTTTTTTIPSINVSPDPIWKSHWILLPYLMVIAGEGTHFNFFNTTLAYEPSGVVFPFLPLIWSELYIWDIILVMPSWLAGEEDQMVTVTVTTETENEVVKGDFEIKSLPFIFDQEGVVE